MSPRGRQRQQATALALCILAALPACSKSPAERAQKAGTALHSWAAATDMLAGAWASGRVPTPYATSALEVAAREIRNQAEQLSSGGSSGSGEQVVAAARLLSAHVAAARAATEHGDRRAGAVAAAVLAQDDSALATLERRLRSGRRPRSESR